MNRGIISALLLTAALTACETAPKKRPVVTPQRMSCTGNHPASITLYSPREAKLVFEEKSYNLERIETPSGIKYGNGDISFWNKGIDALVTRDDGSMTSCTYIPKSGL